MTPQDIAQLLETELPGAVRGKDLEALDPWVVIEADRLAEVARFCKADSRLRFDSLQCLSGVDYFMTDPKKMAKAGFEPHVEVVYHLYSFAHKHKIVLKVMLPRWKDGVVGELPEVPSVSRIWPTADWHERETFDLVGIAFTGHPDLRRILCPEDWVGHPLRKDYEFPDDYHGIRGK